MPPWGRPARHRQTSLGISRWHSLAEQDVRRVALLDQAGVALAKEPEAAGSRWASVLR